jgi:uncharacterized phage infection (PIP) family protein YhgE
MATTVSPRPLEDNREVAALLRYMIQHQQKQTHEDFTALLKTVSALEEQLRATNAELRTVKRELNTVRDSLTPSQRSSGERLVKAAETALRQAGEQLRNIREKIVQTAKNTLESVRQAGISGLNGLSNLLGVRKALRGLKAQMGRTAGTLETGISRMEAAGKELRGAGEHLRNIGRALAGREPLAKQAEKQAAALAPLRGLAGAFRKMEERASHALGALEKLELVAEVKKPSVRETLKKLESRQTDAKAPARENVPGKEAAL